MATQVTYGLALLKAFSIAPYMRTMLQTLVPVESTVVPTAAVDEHARVYWNREFFAKLSIGEAAYVVLHEMFHVWLRHSARAAKLGGGADMLQWNIACDMEINRTLRDMGAGLPGCAIYPDSQPYNFPTDKVAEEYYALLMKKQASQPKPSQAGNKPSPGNDPGDMDQPGDASQPGNSPGQPGDKGDPAKGKPDPKGQGQHGSGVGDSPAEWELPTDDLLAPAVPRVAQDIAADKTAQDINEEATKGRGKMPGGLAQRAADMLRPPTVLWQRVLARVIATGVDRVSGYDEPTYKRLSRTSYGMGVCLPTYESSRPRIVCGIDTSGSMSREDNRECLSEIQGICKRLDTPVTVFAVDTIVGKAVTTDDVRKAKLIGGGGTDMCAGITHAAELKADVCIILTDGDTPWPATPAGRMTVIACITSTGNDKSPPSWIRTVKVHK